MLSHKRRSAIAHSKVFREDLVCYTENDAGEEEEDKKTSEEAAFYLQKEADGTLATTGTSVSPAEDSPVAGGPTEFALEN
jgi:hypothetical protein